MRRQSQRSGRRDNTERIRELVLLLGALSKTGDVVTLDAIQRRLGVSRDEAVAMMDVVCQASGEESAGLLISSNDEGTVFRLQYPGVHGRPLRLTTSETIAVMHALDLAGVAPDDPLRTRLRNVCTSTDVAEGEVRRMLGSGSQLPTPADDETSEVLLACARSLSEGLEIVFSYRGTQDASPRQRHAVVETILPREDTWHVVATDLVIRQQRTFRTDRMRDVILGDYVSSRTKTAYSGSEKTRRIVLLVHDETWLQVFDWPGLRVLSQVNGIIRCDIPYYGDHSTWMLRRLAACDGGVVAEDVRITDAVRRYAADRLDKTTH